MRRMRQLQIGWSFLLQWGDTSHQLVDLEISESYIQCRSVYMSLLVGFNMSLRLLGKGDGWTRFDEEYYSFQVWYTASTARIKWTTHKYGIEMPANGRTSGERYDEYPRAGLNNGNIRMDEFVGEGNGKPDHCILSIRAWSEGTPCLAENNRPCHLRCQDGFHAEG